MPGRQFDGSSLKYRYGFNGKENDNEVKGEGSQQDYGMRIYDPRIGRWFSIDPLQQKYPNLSPYNFVGNNPIIFIDPDGMRIKLSGTTQDKNELLSQIKRLTGLDIQLQKDGQLKLISTDDPNSFSQELREVVLNLLDEKGKHYKNNVVLNLVNNKTGVESRFLDRKKLTSKDILFDNFYSGAVDMEDFGVIQNSNVLYAAIFGHILSERSNEKGGDYELFLSNLNKRSSSEYSSEEKVSIVGNFENAHLAGKLSERAIVNEFITDIEGRPFRLQLRVEEQISMDEIILESLSGKKNLENKPLVIDYGGVKAVLNVDPMNRAKIINGNLKITNKDLKSKNGAIDKD
jgi:RHS repeat-associated protein